MRIKATYVRSTKWLLNCVPYHLESREITSPNRPTEPIERQQRTCPKTDLLTPVYAPPKIHSNQVSHKHASPTSCPEIEHCRVAQVREVPEMMIVEGFVNCVVNVSFVDIVVMESGFDFGKFVQLFGQIGSKGLVGSRGEGSRPLLMRSLSSGRETCQLAVDEGKHRLQFVVIQRP